MNTATFSWATLAPAIPEIALLVLVSTLLIVDLFLDEEEGAVTYWFAVASLLGCAALCAMTIGVPTRVTFQGMFVSDLLSQMLKVATLVSVAATLVYGRTYLQVRGLLRGEFLSLSLFATLGLPTA